MSEIKVNQTWVEIETGRKIKTILNTGIDVPGEGNIWEIGDQTTYHVWKMTEKLIRENYTLQEWEFGKDVEKQREIPTIHTDMQNVSQFVHYNSATGKSIPLSAAVIFTYLQLAPDFKEWEEEYRKNAAKKFINENAVVVKEAWKGVYGTTVPVKAGERLEKGDPVKMFYDEPTSPTYNTMKSVPFVRTTKALEEDEEEE